MTNADLDTIFKNYLSRNEANTITALHEAGFCLDDLDRLIEIGAVKKMVFGTQIHYERRVTSQRAFDALHQQFTQTEIFTR